MSEHTHPVKHALEVAVYAPIGFALEARRLVPTFVERGRNQVAMTRMVGKFAVAQGRTEAAKRAGALGAQVGEVAAEFGLGGEPRGATVAPPPAEPTPEPPRAPSPVIDTAAAGTAADLPIPAYDTLAASQVIPRLEGMAEADLRAVAAYEQAHRQRKTILGKISQLIGA